MSHKSRKAFGASLAWVLCADSVCMPSTTQKRCGWGGCVIPYTRFLGFGVPHRAGPLPGGSKGGVALLIPPCFGDPKQSGCVFGTDRAEVVVQYQASQDGFQHSLGHDWCGMGCV